MKSKIITKTLFLSLLAILFCFIGQSQTWVQFGSNIEGVDAGDAFGQSVSLNYSANILAVSAPSHSGVNQYAGHVGIFSWNGSAWVQMGSAIHGEAALDYSGYDIALNGPGNKLVIGATEAKNSGNFTVGHLRVYGWDGIAWVQQGNDLDGIDTGEELGRSVAINYSGSRIAGGSPYRGNSNGAVTIWEWTGNAWSIMDTSIFGDVNYETSGFDISLDSLGNNVAIASPSAEDSLGITKGAIRVFSWNGASWVAKGSKIFGSNEDDFFGRTVSISADGNTVAAGATDNNNDKGYVRIFDWTGNSWVQRGNDIEGESNGDNSGKAISLSADGNTIAIGSPENSDNGSSSGHVRIFAWDGSAWQQVGSAFVGAATGDDFGKSVSVTNGGWGLAVGGPRNSDSGYLAGHVRAYHYSGIGLREFIQNTTLVYPNPSSGTFKIELAKNEQIDLKIYNTMGELIYIDEKFDTSMSIRLSQPAGCYLVVIQTKNETKLAKLLLKN